MELLGDVDSVSGREARQWFFVALSDGTEPPPATPLVELAQHEAVLCRTRVQDGSCPRCAVGVSQDELYRAELAEGPAAGQGCSDHDSDPRVGQFVEIHDQPAFPVGLDLQPHLAARGYPYGRTAISAVGRLTRSSRPLLRRMITGSASILTMTDGWFEGSLQAPTYWPVDQDCLGQKIVGRCGNTSLVLTFPGPPNPNEPPKLAKLAKLSSPPVDFTDVVIDEYLDGDEPPFFGHFGVINGDLGVAVVTRCAIRVTCPATVLDIDEPELFGWPTAEGIAEARSESRQLKLEEVILSDVHSWLDATGMWLELIAGVEMLAFSAMRSEPPVLRLCDSAHDRWKLPESRDPAYSNLMSTGRPVQATTIEQWWIAADFATRGTPPPLAWRMYHQALRQASHDPRLAVITACGAVEVALASRLNEPLSLLGPAGAETVIKQTGGLLGLARLFNDTFPNDRLKRLKISPSEPDTNFDFSNDLGEVRNRAAHKGQQPETKELKLALQGTRVMLDRIAGPPQEPKPGIT